MIVEYVFDAGPERVNVTVWYWRAAGVPPMSAVSVVVRPVVVPVAVTTGSCVVKAESAVFAFVTVNGALSSDGGVNRRRVALSR